MFRAISYDCSCLLIFSLELIWNFKLGLETFSSYIAIIKVYSVANTRLSEANRYPCRDSVLNSACTSKTACVFSHVINTIRSRPKCSPVKHLAKVCVGWLEIFVNGGSNLSLMESTKCLQSSVMGPASPKVPTICGNAKFVLSYQDKLEMSTIEP